MRAGEFWNHNHLDAGSFIFCQEGVVWADDAGTCTYSLPDYRGYYATPQAHNVAFAPELVPPTGRAAYEGTPAIGEILLSAQNDRLALALADTGILSGGALARSYRWLFLLGGEALLVWDDLSAYAPTPFESLLHTTCAVQDGGAPGEVVLVRGEQRCRVSAFCDSPVELSRAPARMGQCSAPRDDSVAHLEGECLTWRSEPAVRVKLGLAMGTGLVGAKWSHSPEGWECALETVRGPWRVWFNPLADGRVMHQNRIARWDGLETDAYALLSHEGTLMAVDASFVRRGSTPLFSSLSRQPLATTPHRG